MRSFILNRAQEFLMVGKAYTELGEHDVADKYFDMAEVLIDAIEEYDKQKQNNK